MSQNNNVSNHSVKIPVRLLTKEIRNLRQASKLSLINVLTCHLHALHLCTHSFSQEAHNDRSHSQVGQLIGSYIITQLIKHPCSWHRYHTTPNRTGVFQNTSCIVPVEREGEHISSTCAVTRMRVCTSSPMFQVKVSQMHVDQEVSLYSTSIIRTSSKAEST